MSLLNECLKQSLSLFFNKKIYLSETFSNQNFSRPLSLMTHSLKEEVFYFKERQIVKLSKEKSSDIVMIYLHGGAYVFNISQAHYLLITQLVKETEIDTHVLDYPLAPNAHGYTAFDYVCSYIESLNYSKIILIGDSAGAGSARVRAQRHRLPGLRPHHQHHLPGTDAAD